MPDETSPQSDPFPSLDESFAERVQVKLNKRFGKNAPQIAWEDWVKLKPSLAGYAREAEYVRGFLNKSQARILRDISKRSRTLRDAIGRAREAHLEKPICSALDPATLGEFEGLLRKLEEDFRLEGKIAPNFEDTTRVDLFSNFELWWKRSTGLSPTIDEGSSDNTWPTPFMFVANEVFNLPNMPPPTGASYKSLKDFRRAKRKRFEKFERLAEKLKAIGLRE